MRKISKRTIKEWLANQAVPKPPGGLMEKIKKEIPEGLSFRMERKEYLPVRKKAVMLRWQVAACFIIFILGTVSGILISQKFFTDARRAQRADGTQVLRAVPSVPAGESEGFVQAAAMPLSSFDLNVQPASFNLIKDQIRQGKLPSPDLVRPDDIINYFLPEDLPAAGNDFVIQARGATSPFSKDPSYKIIKINLKNYLNTVAKDANVVIEFNPGIVDCYRQIGMGDRDCRDKMIYTIRKNDIPENKALTALYEVKLKQEVMPEDAVATLKLEYVPGDAKLEKIKKIHTMQVPLFIVEGNKPSPDLEFAAMIAKYSQILKDARLKDKDLATLLYQARLLATQIPQKNDLEEFIKIVEATEKITKEAQDIDQ